MCTLAGESLGVSTQCPCPMSSHHHAIASTRHAGTALILFCMGMSGLTQNRSWNVSFLWLQRRVGAQVQLPLPSFFRVTFVLSPFSIQFLTLSYMITDNLLHYYDGDKWVTRVSERDAPPRYVITP